MDLPTTKFIRVRANKANNVHPLPELVFIFN